MSTSRLDFYLGLKDKLSGGLVKVTRLFGKQHKAVDANIKAELKASKASVRLAYQMKRLGKQATKTAKSMRGMSRGVRGLSLVAGAFAAVRLGSAIMTASRSALRFEGQLASLGGNVEDNRREMELLQEQVEHTYSLEALVSAKAKIKAFNLPLALTPNLLKQIQKRSLSMGRDVNYSLNSLIEGLAKGERRILDNLAIVINATNVYKKYATAIGKVKGADLTPDEKSAALTLETQRQLNQASEEMPTKVKELYQAEAKAADAQRELNEGLALMQPLLTNAMFAIAQMAKTIKNSGVIGGFKELGQAIMEAGFWTTMWGVVKGETRGKGPGGRVLRDDPRASLNLWMKIAGDEAYKRAGYEEGAQAKYGDFLKHVLKVQPGAYENEKELLLKRAKELLAIEIQGRHAAGMKLYKIKEKQRQAELKAQQDYFDELKKKNLEAMRDKNAEKKAAAEKRELALDKIRIKLIGEKNAFVKIGLLFEIKSLKIQHKRIDGMNRQLVAQKKLMAAKERDIAFEKEIFKVQTEVLGVMMGASVAQAKKREEDKKGDPKDSPEVIRLQGITRSLQETGNAMSDLNRRGGVLFETMGSWVDIKKRLLTGELKQNRATDARMGLLGNAAASFVENERVKAGILASMELARGFATSVLFPIEAAGHFAAAAMFGAIAAGAGGGGGGGGGGGAAGGSAVGSPEDLDDATSGAGGGQPQQANIVINFSDGIVLGSRQDIGRGIMEATRSLNKTGISAGAF